MQELLKHCLEISLQVQKNNIKLLQHNPAVAITEYWIDSPIGQYYCDLLLDLSLKTYYWPMYLAGQEGKISEWFKPLLTGNLCRPGE